MDNRGRIDDSQGGSFDLTVLIADDEEPERQTIRTLISRNHLDLQVVAKAADGDEAMDLTIT